MVGLNDFLLYFSPNHIHMDSIEVDYKLHSFPTWLQHRCDRLMFISRASSFGGRFLSAGGFPDFFAPSVLFFYIAHLFLDELNWFHL